MFAAPYLVLGAAIAVAAAGATGYLQGRDDGRELCQAADARERQIGIMAADAAASAAAVQIAKIRVQQITVRQEVEREVRENVVYRDCGHSPDQLQRINAAITGGAPPQPAGGGQLPRADAVDRSELRSDYDENAGDRRPVP